MPHIAFRLWRVERCGKLDDTRNFRRKRTSFESGVASTIIRESRALDAPRLLNPAKAKIIVLGGHAGFRNRANLIAFWLVEMALAFGAFLRIDDKGIPLHRNRSVGTFEFTNAATGAL